MEQSIQVVYPELVGSYARSIYVFGNRTISSLDEEYRVPVMTYAANSFPQKNLDTALARNYITQQEYLDTLALKTA